jgi:hypothetical protein
MIPESLHSRRQVHPDTPLMGLLCVGVGRGAPSSTVSTPTPPGRILELEHSSEHSSLPLTSFAYRIWGLEWKSELCGVTLQGLCPAQTTLCLTPSSGISSSTLDWEFGLSRSISYSWLHCYCRRGLYCAAKDPLNLELERQFVPFSCRAVMVSLTTAHLTG